MDSSKSVSQYGGVRRSKTTGRKGSKSKSKSKSMRTKTAGKKGSKRASKRMSGGARRRSKTKGRKGSKRTSKRTSMRTSKRTKTTGRKGSKHTQKGGACTNVEVNAAKTFAELLTIVQKHQTDIKACDRCNDTNIVSLLTGLRDIYETKQASGEAMLIPTTNTEADRNLFDSKYNKNGSKLICNKCGIRAKIYQLLNQYIKNPEERLNFQL
jgi:hypothetical protein